MTPQNTNTLPEKPQTEATLTHTTPALTNEEKKALEHYEKTHHLSALPHEDADEGVEHSRGEKSFNTVTYKGLGWLLNAGISVYVTDLFMHGAGKKHFDNGAKSIAPYYERITGASKEVSLGASRSGMMMLGLFSGGTILLLPIKRLEDNKAAIVKWLDNKINQWRTPSSEQLEVQENAHKRLEADPKPSWGNVILGRVLGTVAVLTVAMGIAKGRDETFSNYAAGKIGDAMQDSASVQVREIGKSYRFRNMTAISMVEIYTSLIAEAVLYYTTRAYRSLWHKKQAALATTSGNDAAQEPDSKLAHAAFIAEDAHTPSVPEKNKSGTPTSVVANHVIAQSHQPLALELGA